MRKDGGKVTSVKHLIEISILVFVVAFPLMPALMISKSFGQDSFLTEIINAFGSHSNSPRGSPYADLDYEGSPRWNPNADLNHDGIVDMKDIAIYCRGVPFLENFDTHEMGYLSVTVGHTDQCILSYMVMCNGSIVSDWTNQTMTRNGNTFNGAIEGFNSYDPNLEASWKIYETNDQGLSSQTMIYTIWGASDP